MSLSFTTQQRLDITRRMLNILQENAAYNMSLAQFNTLQAQLLNVDSANAAIYGLQTAQAAAYENEGRAINGTIATTYSDGTISPFAAGDLSSSAQFPGSAAATFYPPGYGNFIPDLVNALNGFNNPTGTDAAYEVNILNNPPSPLGLQQLINFLLNGTSSGSASTLTNTAIPAGPVASFAVTVDLSLGFSSGDYVYIGTGAACGIYIVNSVITGSISVTSLVPTLVGITTRATITNLAAGFTETERETLTATYQEILNNLATDVTASMTAWQGKINSQITNLNSQQEIRSTQQSQNATALSNANSILSLINTWAARSSTGVNGKYANNGINPISAAISPRLSFLTTRISQITTDLGSVATSGNIYSGVVGSPYYERYKWLDHRLNISSGSARRYFAANQNMNITNTLIANNTTLSNDYAVYFLTKALTNNDGSNILFVTDLAGLSNGDIITVVSETQPEISRTIVQLMGTTQIQINSAVPISYTIQDKARIFKTL